MNRFAHKVLKESFLNPGQPSSGLLFPTFSPALPMSYMVLRLVHSQLEGRSLISNLMLTTHQEMLLNVEYGKGERWSEFGKFDIQRNQFT